MSLRTMTAGQPTRHHEGAEIVPVRHWGRITLAVLVIIGFIIVVQSFATNPNIDWAVVWEFLFSPAILTGLWGTLQLTFWSMIFATTLAVVIAVMRTSESKIISGFAAGYVYIFRGIPLIVLLIFVGNLGLFFKVFALGIPFTDIVFFSVPSKDVMTPFIAAIIGLSLAGSGYMAEIVRAGLLSVGRGQREAAKALGCGPGTTLRYIVMPQALKVLIPPMGNELIGMLKATSIVSVIAGGDLLTMALGISGLNYRTIELLIVATIWYLLVISVLSVAQYFVERRTAER
jgi:polar amino acid transport system permease protein